MSDRQSIASFEESVKGDVRLLIALKAELIMPLARVYTSLAFP